MNELRKAVGDGDPRDLARVILASLTLAQRRVESLAGSGACDVLRAFPNNRVAVRDVAATLPEHLPPLST